MSPIQAVKTVLRKYVKFSGRARRSEFWWFYLFSLVLGIISLILDGVLFGQGEVQSNGSSFNAATSTGPLNIIVTLALLLPSLAVSWRRLHDIGRSGWWILIGLIPLIGTIVLIVFYATDSKPDNEYGPSPKGATGAVTA